MPDKPSEQGKLKAESALPVARGNCGALATRRLCLGRQAAQASLQAWQTDRRNQRKSLQSRLQKWDPYCRS